MFISHLVRIDGLGSFILCAESEDGDQVDRLRWIVGSREGGLSFNYYFSNHNTPLLYVVNYE